jgi:Ca2+-binding EF-hand superfamily protein
MRLLDTDNDGTVDLDEAKKAASALFEKLDRDHDGTLDRRELRGRLNAAEFASADPDKDGTLSKDEYLKVVADSGPPIPTMTGRWTKRNYARARGRHCCGCCTDPHLGDTDQSDETLVRVGWPSSLRKFPLMT